MYNQPNHNRTHASRMMLILKRSQATIVLFSDIDRRYSVLERHLEKVYCKRACLEHARREIKRARL
jgi:hypothetical protein